MFRAYSELGSDLGLCYLPAAHCGKVLSIYETSVSPSVKWVWSVKEDCMFFATPPIERWNLISPPLKIGLTLMSLMAIGMWQN